MKTTSQFGFKSEEYISKSEVCFLLWRRILNSRGAYNMSVRMCGRMYVCVPACLRAAKNLELTIVGGLGTATALEPPYSSSYEVDGDHDRHRHEQTN